MKQSMEGERVRRGEGTRATGAVDHIFIWETLFWFGQMWEPEAKPHSQM